MEITPGSIIPGYEEKGTEITSTKDDLNKSRGLKFTWLPDEGYSKPKCPF